MILPFYSDNKECFDFSHIAPVTRDSFALYVHPNVALLFKDMHNLTSNKIFVIADILEAEKDLDCTNFDRKLDEFNPYRKARVRRTFEKDRPSIFFDEDEIDFLEGLFDRNNFTGIVSIYVKGQEYNLSDLDDKVYSIVQPFIEELGLIEQVDCDEFRNFYKKKSKGVRGVFKNKLLLKNILPGLLIAGVGAVMAFAGYKKSIETMDIAVPSDTASIPKDMENDK